jgi:hypothetical protein
MSGAELKQGVSLTIRIGVSARTVIEFLDPDGRVLLEVNGPLSLNSLGPYRRKLAAGLEKLRRNFAVLTQTNIEAAGAALADFHRVGRGLLHDLFGDENAHQLKDAALICSEACLGTSQEIELDEIPLPWDDGAVEPKLIKLDYDVTTGIALELLPLLNPLLPRRVTNLIEFGRLARQFLGIAAVTHHVPSAAEPPELRNMPLLPMRLYIHEGLPMKYRMRQFFTPDNGFSVEREWPPLNGNDSPAIQLASSLWKHREDTTGKALDREIQLNHFECHCSPADQGSVLHFSDGVIRSFVRSGIRGVIEGIEVSSCDLHDAIRDLRLPIAPIADADRRPLVFLNACASAALDPGELSPFSKLFVATDFRGFIGTQAVVPDVFAATFAERFYGHFFSGLAIGRALYEAAWDSLRDDKNALGLIYFLHADPKITVATPKRARAVRSSRSDASSETARRLPHSL